MITQYQMSVIATKIISTIFMSVPMPLFQIVAEVNKAQLPCSVVLQCMRLRSGSLMTRVQLNWIAISV